MPPGPSQRAWVRRAVRVAVVLALADLGTVTTLAVFQDSFLFPGAGTQGRPEAEFTTPPGCARVTLTAAGGERVVALFGPALNAAGRPLPDAASRPTLIYFYGNGMCLAYALGEFDQFRRLGVNVLVPDYLGYGLSGGHASEAGCYAAADAAYAHLQTRRDIDARRIIAAGWSLGGAVAIDLATRRPVAGLAVFSTFTSIRDAARAHVPFVVPVGLLVRNAFDSAGKIGRVTCPILIGHGKRDSIIPFSMMDRLIAAAHCAGHAPRDRPGRPQ